MKDFVDADNSRHVYALPGDYNADKVLPRSSKDSKLNANGSLLIDFCRQTGLRIANGRVGSDSVVGECTYVGTGGSSLVDYVLVSEDLLQCFDEFTVHDPNPYTDHCVIEFSVNVYKATILTQVNSDNSVKLDSKYQWDKTKCDDFKTNVASADIDSKFSQIFDTLSNDDCTDNIDKCVENFVAVIDNVCKPLFEKKCKSPESTKMRAASYDHECEIKRMHFFDKLNKYRKDKSDINRVEMVRARSCFKSSVRKYKRECMKQKTNKHINTRYKDAKEYWKLLKQSQQSKPSKLLLADTFGQYFKAINDPQSPFYQADEDIIAFNDRFLNSEAQVMFGELDVAITQKEIVKAIKEVKTSRSGGSDRLLNEFFINGSNNLLPYLHTLLNVLFDKCYFPTMWSEGYIVPIHKKGSTNNVDNYRGITLLSTLGKLFTSILNNRLINWAESYYVYIEAQAGFRREMGTVDNIFLPHGLITHLINQGKKLYCAFVDFKKAFDFVNRDIIWYKLIKLGVRGKMLNVIKSMYAKVKARVKFNNELSELFESYLDVRQGECLSPFLSSMYLNDIEEEFY